MCLSVRSRLYGSGSFEDPHRRLANWTVQDASAHRPAARLTFRFSFRPTTHEWFPEAVGPVAVALSFGSAARSSHATQSTAPASCLFPCGGNGRYVRDDSFVHTRLAIDLNWEMPSDPRSLRDFDPGADRRHSTFLRGAFQISVVS